MKKTMAYVGKSDNQQQQLIKILKGNISMLNYKVVKKINESLNTKDRFVDTERNKWNNINSRSKYNVGFKHGYCM